MPAPTRTALPPGALPRVLVVVALLMLAGGIAQMVAPGASLRSLGAASPDDATARFAYGVVGGLVAVFGGLLLHALFDGARWRQLFLWLAVEKLTYAAAFALAAADGVLGGPAWLVAAYDLVAGGAAFAYFARRRAE